MAALSDFLENNLLNHVLGGSTAKVVEDCEDAWDETANANVTQTIVTDRMSGAGAVKMDVADVQGIGILATEVITSLDISNGKKVTLWIKPSVALASGDLQLLLDDTAGCASPVHTLNIPACTAGIWNKVVMPYDGSLLGSTAIISVGLKMAVDKGIFNLIIDDVRIDSGYSQPGPVYVALFTTDPTDAGTGTEVSGGAYARQEFPFKAASAGSVSNATDITFPVATASWGTITHIGLYDASTAGNLLFHGALSASKAIATNDQFIIKTDNLSISLS